MREQPQIRVVLTVKFCSSNGQWCFELFMLERIMLRMLNFFVRVVELRVRLKCITSRSAGEQRGRVRVTISNSFAAESSDFFSYVVRVYTAKLTAY